ncbi:hypothetical protein BD779DRAFT_1543033 [Infundibulicybe gibba]|nr:hypothetical protein BD779DRAFT_1543033 [Infundibulicybe gibba]
MITSPTHSVVRFFLPSPTLTHVTPKDDYKRQLVHRRTTRRRRTNISATKNVCEARRNTCYRSSPTPTTLVLHHAPTPFCSRPIPALAYIPPPPTSPADSPLLLTIHHLCLARLHAPPHSVSSGSQQVPLLHQLVCMARLRGICSAGWGGVGEQWACNTAVNSGVREYRQRQSMRV